ncbi:hypothetical protein pb186bvf_007059 [Paramecium bursaria]
MYMKHEFFIMIHNIKIYIFCNILQYPIRSLSSFMLENYEDNIDLI